MSELNKIDRVAGARVAPRLPSRVAREGRALHEGKALPRYRRAGTSAAGLVLQERDLALLEDLRCYRLLTTSQLETLRSADPRSDCRFVSRLPLTRRLKLLFHHGHVRRIARPLAAGSLEPVYMLDNVGIKALSRWHDSITHGEGSLGTESETGTGMRLRSPSQLPKPAALEHLLAINQFRVSLAVACSTAGSTARGGTAGAGREEERVQFLSWHSGDKVKFSVQTIERGERTRTTTLVPDGFFALRAGGQGRRKRLFFFLEVDLGTEPARTLSDKCRTYYEYWKSGGFAHDFSVPPQMCFHVLFVAPGIKRMESIHKAIGALEAGRTMFWTTAQEHMVPERILVPMFHDGATGSRCSLAGEA